MNTQNRKIQTVMLASLAFGVNAPAMADTNMLRAETCDALAQLDSRLDLGEIMQADYQDSDEDSNLPATCCGSCD